MELTAQNLKKHGFNVIIAKTEEEVGILVKEMFLKFITEYYSQGQDNIQPVVSYGDSLTIYQIDKVLGEQNGILNMLRNYPDIKFLDGFRKDDPRHIKLRIRREAILSDFYITGVNAITSSGSLYWVDMVGNRVASVVLGASQAIIIAGKNKIVQTEEDADKRVRSIAAPLNIARHPGFKTPCAKTGYCMNCNSPDRICNVRLLMERCHPAGRITVILIDKDLGL